MSRNLKVSVLVFALITLLFAVGASARPTVAIFDGTEQKIGYNSTDDTYTVSSYAGWGDMGANEFRAFMDFDLSSLNGSIGFNSIQSIELYYDAGYTIVSYPAPSTITGNIYIGDFMDDGLSSADWDAGTFDTSNTWNGAPSDTWITLGQEALNQFYNFQPGSIQLLAPDHFSLAIHNGTNDEFLAGINNRCKIRVTYYPPKTAKAAEETSTFGSVKSLYR